MNHSELATAYHETDYRVDGPGEPFIIRIGEISQPLERLLESNKVRSWAFITACNPNSQKKSDEENAEKMQRLKAEVTAASYSVFHGEGIGRRGDWPPEPNLLILAIDEPTALELARRFGQNAFVFGAIGQMARLVWTE